MIKFRLFKPVLLQAMLLSIPVWVGVISCELITPYEKSTPTLAPRNAWLAKWLKEPVCQPPCFLGITPGRTTITETIQLLSQMPDIQITRGPVTSTDGTDKELSWEFTTSTKYDGARMITDKEGKYISVIDMGPGIDQSLTLAEIISSYGLPDHIYIYDCQTRQCAVHIIYMSSGMVLDLLLPAKVDDKHSVEISPDVQVDEIWFFKPGEGGYREAFGFLADPLSEKQIQWNGYTTYKEK